VCSALGKPEWLDDPRFTTRRERSKHTAVVQEAMLGLLANMTMKEVIAHFTEHDVVAAPVNTIPQAAQDPHPWERRAMVEVPDFLAGSIAVSGDFWHFSRTPAIVGSTPKVGEHNEEVLGALLGYSEEEIAKLYANNVISNTDHYDTLSG
jgi:formyl-CoA transferase